MIAAKQANNPMPLNKQHERPAEAGEHARRCEEKFEKLLTRCSDGVVIFDAAGTIIEYNPAQERLTGTKKTQAMGKKIWDLQTSLIPKEKPRPAAALDLKEKYAGLLKTGVAEWLNRETEVEIQKTDGSRGVLRTVVFPVGSGQSLTYCSLSRDTTEQRRIEKELSEGNRRLLLKNVALHEVLFHYGEKERRLYEEIWTKIERSVLPVLSRLQAKSGESERKLLFIIGENLREVVSGKGKQFPSEMNRLTQKEIEICDLIKRGMSCKEIGSLLNISFRTVETHRNRIRKKLGITGPSINLSTYLRNM